MPLGFVETQNTRTAHRRRSSGRRRASRILRHLALAAGSAAACGALYVAIASDDPVFRLSMATAYVALGLLAITLSIGPIARRRGRRYPVSTDLRRDFGIWTGIIGLVHVIAGLQVHMRGKMWEYFVRTYGDSNTGVTLPRIDPFGLANYTGAIATVFLVVLTVTSNDSSLRRLGTGRWQRVHRLVDWTLWLTIAHAVAYQLIEKRRWDFAAALAGCVLALAFVRYSRRGFESAS